MSLKSQSSIASLVAQLAGDDSASRLRARNSLVSLGGFEVARAAVGELVDPRTRVRWEAAKILVELADPVAAPALVQALDDEEQSVRWVAAEGLIALRWTGLLTVLSGLIRRAGSPEFCRSAHHVLHELRESENAGAIDPVLEALSSLDPEVAAPVAARSALVTLKQRA